MRRLVRRRLARRSRRGGLGTEPSSTALRIPLLLLSFGLLILVAGSKVNAAKPPLGPVVWFEEINYHPSPRATTLILIAAYALGAGAVLVGLARPRIGRRHLWWALLLAGVTLAVTAPIGSGDHTNYAAYGRIAVQGGDPYAQSPEAWREGLDPITASVQPPWRSTPSIYGPLGTALMAVSSAIGGDNLRLTVLVWQVFIVAAWLAMRWLLLALAEGERSYGRIEVLWTYNPLVFGVLVLGAHVDMIAAAFAVGALVALHRSPLTAGMLVGAAASTKLTYGVVALGIAWAWRAAVQRHPSWRSPAGHGLRRLLAPWRTAAARELLRDLAVGALVVVVPCYVVAGPNVLRQLGAAGGSFSLATPAAPIWRGLRHVLPEWAVGTIVMVLAAVCMIGLAWILLRVAAKVRLGRRIPDATTRQAVVTTWALSTAYVLAAPYSLPWYDALVWALLPLLLEMRWDAVLLGRYLVMVLAYVPGRVLGLTPGVEAFTLNFRRNVAPWGTTAALLLMVWVCWRKLREPRERPARAARILRRSSGQAK